MKVFYMKTLMLSWYNGNYSSVLSLIEQMKHTVLIFATRGKHLLRVFFSIIHAVVREACC